MSKQQLTIEHLAPYLPYGVEGFWSDLNDDYPPIKVDIVGVTKTNGFGLQIVTYNSGGYGYSNFNEIKPILRPLSDLTFEHRDNLKDQYDVGVDCDSAQMFRDRDGSTNPLEWRYDDIQYLLKNHYDIFGLIDKNLAVNINDLKDEKRNKI